MTGSQMLDENERHARIGGQLSQQIREGLQATGGSADRNNRKGLVAAWSCRESASAFRSESPIVCVGGDIRGHKPHSNYYRDFMTGKQRRVAPARGHNNQQPPSLNKQNIAPDGNHEPASDEVCVWICGNPGAAAPASIVASTPRASRYNRAASTPSQDGKYASSLRSALRS